MSAEIQPEGLEAAVKYAESVISEDAYYGLQVSAGAIWSARELATEIVRAYVEGESALSKGSKENPQD